MINRPTISDIQAVEKVSTYVQTLHIQSAKHTWAVYRKMQDPLSLLFCIFKSRLWLTTKYPIFLLRKVTELSGARNIRSARAPRCPVPEVVRRSAYKLERVPTFPENWDSGADLTVRESSCHFSTTPLPMDAEDNPEHGNKRRRNEGTRKRGRAERLLGGLISILRY